MIWSQRKHKVKKKETALRSTKREAPITSGFSFHLIGGDGGGRLLKQSPSVRKQSQCSLM